MLNQHFTAYRAVLALCQTFSFVCGFNSGVNDYGVTQRGYNLLLCKNFAAHRAVFAFGKTCLGAGCLYCLVNDYSGSQQGRFQRH